MLYVYECDYVSVCIRRVVRRAFSWFIMYAIFRGVCVCWKLRTQFLNAGYCRQAFRCTIAETTAPALATRMSIYHWKPESSFVYRKPYFMEAEGVFHQQNCFPMTPGFRYKTITQDSDFQCIHTHPSLITGRLAPVQLAAHAHTHTYYTAVRACMYTHRWKKKNVIGTP